MMQREYEAIASRAEGDVGFREGLLSAARVCRAQGGSTPGTPSCPSSVAATYIESLASGGTP